ncbi:MAG: hypothetical protein A3D31_10500 [Candidatus Fluviicola riflensis]|nr:MAG: hypothetical protein CHH17_14920 [Candidatus Fluviicola riflensis]OGS77429.1 MAG: hypothetical protein A3D31_10500 [Candidatus Fluviicola riflensis]OGS84009.1 MAG: hypothetical protein A3E30_11900 [Fluviicola sp. RIFCSPHIGHO2_12_FULL_43_24]OGS84496.1 MAG: hypothetical protein A2724_07440 [Fluviicola sp. RIFCSPHIGHO2_01_FULL_43_53]
MDAAEFTELMTAFKAQTAIQPAKNDPFSMSLFVQYIIASNLSDMKANVENNTTSFVPYLESMNENLANIEAKLAELSTKLTDIEQAITTHV